MKRDFGHVGAILATRADFALDALCKKSRPTPQISSPRSVWREDLANDQPIASSGVETVHSAVLQDALAKETVDVDNDNVGNCCGCGWRGRCARVCRRRRIAASGGCPPAPSL